MTRKFPLQPLLELSQDRLDQAGKRLNELKVRWNGAEERLQQLVDFCREYQERLRGSSSSGMSVASYRDYQLFLGKIELAVKQQREEVKRCQERWEQGQRDWLEQRRQNKAFDTLANRHVAAEARRENKREQKELDEYATRKPMQKPDPFTFN
jgi:flagellar FliJ protein